MAPSLSVKDGDEWERFMLHYPPPWGAAVRLQCQWFFAMTGIPWKGDASAYRLAATAWHEQFKCANAVAKYSADLVDGAGDHPTDAFVGFLSTSLEACVECTHCGALLLRCELRSARPCTGSICCVDGQVHVDDPDYTLFPSLYRWWTAFGTDEVGQHGRVLREHARSINNALAMASCRVQMVRQTGWNPCTL